MENISSAIPTSKYTFIESIQKQGYIYVIGIFMIVLIMFIYYYIVGFKTKFTRILGIILFTVLVLNIVLSGIEPVAPYTVEVSLQKYIESNAQSFLPFGVALAALVIASTKNKEMANNKEFLMQLLTATCCFVFVMTVVLIPKESGKGIRISRDIKAAVLTLGGVMVIVLVSEFALNKKV